MFIDALVSGLATAALYAIAAIGLAIVYGVLDVLNFAHGVMIAAGAYLVIAVTGLGANYGIAVMVAVVVVGGVGLLLHLGLFRRVEKNHIAGLIVSIGLIGIGNTVFLEVWGPDPLPYRPLVDGAIPLFGAFVPTYRILIIGIAIAILVALEWAIRRTSWGKTLRATSEDGEAAALQGVPVGRVKAIGFTLGAALAGFAGALVVTTEPASTSMAHTYVMNAFLIIIIGGMGSTQGAMVGALILGLAEAFAKTYANAGVATIVPLVVLAAVLLIRPQGIFGREAARA